MHWVNVKTLIPEDGMYIGEIPYVNPQTGDTYWELAYYQKDTRVTRYLRYAGPIVIKEEKEEQTK